MLTPWVNPVTAGKKIANRAQNGISELGARLARSWSVLAAATPPAKNATKAAARTAITTYWNRVAQSAPSQARTKSSATATAATICGSRGPAAPTRPETASPKPIA
jgi:hypothetical protein